MSRPHNTEEALLRAKVWKVKGGSKHTQMVLLSSSETYFPL